MTTQITPRPHAEMCARYMADKRMKCWMWSKHHKAWLVNADPHWFDNRIYHVGLTPPSKPPMEA